MNWFALLVAVAVPAMMAAFFFWFIYKRGKRTGETKEERTMRVGRQGFEYLLLTLMFPIVVAVIAAIAYGIKALV